jgi:hypothetical protein
MDKIKKFPKTIVLTINTHGGIDCKKKNNTNDLEFNWIYPIIEVPVEIKNLIIIDSVPFGISINISKIEIEKNINIIAKNYYNQYKNIKELSMKQIDLINDKNIEEIKKDTLKNKLNIFNNQKYLRCIELKNIYNKKNYKSGDKIVNKSFCYEQKDKTNIYKNIKIINKDIDHIDLFDLVNTDKYFDGYQTTLENLLNFLINKGVENIIIYDFSCYTFLPNNKISERTIRNFRKEINNKLN